MLRGRAQSLWVHWDMELLGPGSFHRPGTTMRWLKRHATEIPIG